MRISFILSSLWLSGGVRVIVEYANRLTIRNHKATLIAPRGTLDPDVLGEPGNAGDESGRIARTSTDESPVAGISQILTTCPPAPHSRVFP